MINLKDKTISELRLLFYETHVDLKKYEKKSNNAAYTAKLTYLNGLQLKINKCWDLITAITEEINNREVDNHETNKN